MPNSLVLLLGREIQTLNSRLAGLYTDGKPVHGVNGTRASGIPCENITYRIIRVIRHYSVTHAGNTTFSITQDKGTCQISHV